MVCPNELYTLSPEMVHVTSAIIAIQAIREKLIMRRKYDFVISEKGKYLLMGPVP
jgi:hypothetical protein